MIESNRVQSPGPCATHEWTGSPSWYVRQVPSNVSEPGMIIKTDVGEISDANVRPLAKYLLREDLVDTSKLRLGQPLKARHPRF